MPVSSSIDADGWTLVNYVSDGIQSTVEFPPVGFDTAQASDAMLARHGLPVRPQSAPDLAQWTARMGNLQWARSQGDCVSHQFSFGTKEPHKFWGGDLYEQTSNYDFNGVQADITQVSYLGGCPPADPMAAVGSWVGLGGYSTNAPLIQTGTVAQSSGYSAWWELIDLSGSTYTPLPQVTVRAGDVIWLYVNNVGADFWVLVDDETNNTVVDTEVANPVLLVGSTAEFIDERPLLSDKKTYADLPEYSLPDKAPYTPDWYLWTYWSQMQVLRSNSSTWTGAYSEPDEIWLMMTKDGTLGGTELEYTSGSFSDNHMQDHWHHC
jgi:hypothetical protein